MAKTIHITKNALWRREGEGVVILEEATGEPYHLDAVGAFVFEALRDGPTFEDLVARVREEYAGDEARIRGDVESFLAGLLQLKLVEVRE